MILGFIMGNQIEIRQGVALDGTYRYNNHLPSVETIESKKPKLREIKLV
jgi:hypothetical protein